MVIPGDLLAVGYSPGPGTFSDRGSVYSSVVGLAKREGEFARVVALEGKYIPQSGDLVIGVVKDSGFTSWLIDINSPYLGVLDVKDALDKFDPVLEDTSDYFRVGDTLLLKVKSVDSVRRVSLTIKEDGLGEINGGKLIKISPTKIPRLIGKKGSMIKMLKHVTGCDIIIAQNGVVWINGEERVMEILSNAIEKIEKEAHTSGLTDRIKEMLSKKLGGEYGDSRQETVEESSDRDTSSNK